jgi:hypothetical protein
LIFLISNFRRVLNVVCFLSGNSSAPEVHMPTFRNTLFHLHMQVGVCRITRLPACEDGTECSETSAYKLQTPGNYPKESKQSFDFIEIRSEYYQHENTTILFLHVNRTVAGLCKKQARVSDPTILTELQVCMSEKKTRLSVKFETRWS